MEERRETVTAGDGRRLDVRIGDGRRLDVRIAGPDDGGVVFANTGTPDDGKIYPPNVRTGADRGLRHVSYARPGYAESDRAEGRTVADCVDDVAAIADEIGVGRFHVVGSSGGAPHALACAALMPGRVISAATIAGVAPYNAEGLDWGAGMGEENLEEMELAERGADELEPWMESQAEELRRSTPEDLHRILGDLVLEPDRAVLTGEFAEQAHSSLVNSVRNGIWGWLDDDLAFVRSWEFDLEVIRVPVTIWQGVQDRFVPISHGRWLAQHVPGARPRLLEGEGHLSLSVGRYGDILDELIAG